MRNKMLFTFLILGLFVLNRPIPLLAATATVAILPFQINAEKDYGFLQKGIVDMLASRLATPDKIIIIDPLVITQAMNTAQEMSGESLSLFIGNQVKADYVIHGSITALGESISIDARTLDITGSRPPLTFFKITQGMNEVIPQINALATEILTQVFYPQIPAQTQVFDPIEKKAPENLTADSEKPPQEILQQSEKNEPSLRIADQFWKSPNMINHINGLAVGDVNMDGLNEVIIADDESTLIVQFNGVNMRQLAVIDNPIFTNNIAVDVGDINHNGTPEIFVTAMSGGQNTLSSFVLEYDGSAYRKTQSEAKWYFRVVDHPEKGLMLLGQTQLLDTNPFAAPINELTWDGGEYGVKTTVLTGEKANAIGVAVGISVEGGLDAILAFDPSDRLQLFNSSSQKIYTTNERFGGSTLHILMRPQGSDTTIMTEKKAFLPLRIRVVDINNDGKMEVMVPQNIDKVHRLLGQQRFFKNARLVALNWDGLGLFPIWQTREIEGRIQDIFIGDFNNDGKIELLAAVVTKEGAFIGTSPESALIAYTIY